jgi:hypothetical protein
VDANSKTQIDNFLTNLKKYPDMWDSLELRIVAKKESDSYVVLGMQGMFLRDALPIFEVLLDLDEVVLFRKIISINDQRLIEFLNELKNDIIKIDDLTLKLNNFWRYTSQIGDKYYHNYLNIDLSWPCLGLMSVGNKSVREIINEEITNSQLLEWGYRDLESASSNLINIAIGGSRYPLIYLIAPIYVKSQFEFKDGTLSATVKFHKSVDKEDLLITYNTNENKPGRIQFASDDSVDKINDFIQVNKKESLSLTTKSITLWTLYKKDSIDENTIFNPFKQRLDRDPKLIAIKSLMHREYGESESADEQFKRNLGLFRDRKGKSAEAFESAILNLMSLAGCETIFLGKGVDAKGIDILAFLPETNNIIVISCTISNKIDNKIETLLPQLNMLKKQLEDYQLIPAIFSPIAFEDTVFTNRTNLAEHQIALLLPDDINKIYEEIQKNSRKELREFLLKYIKDKIPFRTKPGGMFD